MLASNIHVHTLYTYIGIHTILLPAVLAVQIKATSSEWVQSSNPIVLARQLMSLLSVPEQRSSSSHVRVNDEASEKL